MNITGKVGTAMSQPLNPTVPGPHTATGLPAGLTLDANGNVTGTPQAAGTGTFQVNSPGQPTQTVNYTIAL